MLAAVLSHPVEQVMFHHNCVVRRQHMDGSSFLSYDQRLAHEIIGGWADRVASDPSLCADRSMVEPFVARMVKEMDGHFGRVLSLRNSDRFKGIVGAAAQAPVRH